MIFANHGNHGNHGAPRRANRLNPPRGFGRPRILLIDDDPDVLAILEQALAREGYEVHCCRDAAEIVARSSSSYIRGFGPVATIDVVVTDQCMPVVNGLDLIESMKARRWHARTVLMSAFVDEDIRVAAKRLGVTAVVTKPFNVNELLDVLEHVTSP